MKIRFFLWWLWYIRPTIVFKGKASRNFAWNIAKRKSKLYKFNKNKSS